MKTKEEIKNRIIVIKKMMKEETSIIISMDLEMRLMELRWVLSSN